MSTLLDKFELGPVDADVLQPVALAFVGDTLFDLYLRTHLVSLNSLNPHELHEKASSYANAGAQAKMAHNLLDSLTEEEERVLKRSRNQKSISVPKNASPVDYKWATGFETLLGWLYFENREDRLMELMKLAVDSLKKENEDE